MLSACLGVRTEVGIRFGARCCSAPSLASAGRGGPSRDRRIKSIGRQTCWVSDAHVTMLPWHLTPRAAGTKPDLWHPTILFT